MHLEFSYVLVQPENGDRARSVSECSALRGGDFHDPGLYRSDEDLEATQGTSSVVAIHRLDQPIRLSRGMVASPQIPFPFCQASSLNYLNKFNSLLAQEYHRINRQRALRGNPRSQQPQQ